MQVEDIGRTSQSGSDSHKEFEKFLLIAHFLAARAACKNVPQLDTIVAKLSASLLRYSDIIPADKAFYEAGLHSQVHFAYGNILFGEYVHLYCLNYW